MATIKKTHVYKLYSGNQYLCNIPNVISDFGYDQNINTAGSVLDIEFGNKFDDVGAEQIDTFWVDENGNHIVDEGGNDIVFETSIDLTDIPINLANRVKVYTFDKFNINGKLVFDGLISKWGAGYRANTTRLSVLSYGVQANHHLLLADPTSQTIDQEAYNQDYALSSAIYKPFVPPNHASQSFNLVADTIIGSLAIVAYKVGSGAVDVEWRLYNGTPSSPGSLVTSGSITSLDTTAGFVILAFSTPQTLTAGDYFVDIYNNGGSTSGWATPYLKYSDANPYASGGLYESLDGGVTYSAISNSDLAFIVYGSNGSRTLSYSNQDPSIIIERIMTQLSSQGGIPSYSNSSIDMTNTSVSYTYKVATILEGIQTAYDLAPEGWFWYISPATNLLHFHQQSITEEHILRLGVHLDDFDVEHSLEQIINYDVFSGGDTGSGQNLFAIFNSPASISQYGQWLTKQSDNRVTDYDTASVLANGILGRNSAPSFIISVEISAEVYDIESFEIGDVVGLRDFNNLLDTEPLQIVGRSPRSNSVILRLGNIQPQQSSTVEELKRRLTLLETIANPDSPS